MTKRHLVTGLVVLIVLVLGAWYARTGMEGAKTEEEGVKTNGEMLAGEGGLEIRFEDVEYHPGRTGHYAEPVEDGDHPGVVMIHEWWGLNDHIRGMARELAERGYRVMAVDLFGSVASTPEEARAQTSALVQEEALDNMRAAMAYLRGRGSERIGSLGWCFGGGQSLQLGLAEDLDATVIYYGRLVTDRGQLESLDEPVLGIFGAEDASIPVAEVEAFDEALDGVGTAHDITVYPGVGHAFANPSGANYAPEPTMDAWIKTLAFLEAHL